MTLPSAIFTSSELKAWYDPSDFYTLFQDTAGTTAVTATGQPVRKMLDKSTNGNHVTFSGTNPPTLGRVGSTGGYYLQPVDATSRGLCTGMTLSQPATACMYINYTHTHNGTVYDSYVDNGGMLTMMNYTSGTNVSNGSHANAVTLSTSAPEDKVIIAYHNGSSTTIRANGVTSSAGVGDSNGLNGLSLFDIGGSPTPIAAGYNCTEKFYGLFFVNRALTGGELKSVENYLLERNLPDYQAKFLVSGDSTVAAYLGYNSVSSYLSTPLTVHDIAVPGDTIADQKADFDALPYLDYARFNKVVVQIGLNDVSAASASSKITALQGYVDDIRAKIQPQSKITISKMTPAKQRWIDLFGSTDGATAQTCWTDINEAIAGNGATPITNVDYRASNHATLLDDGAGNLAAAYDHGDHIHENNAGRQIVAASWQAAFEEFLTPGLFTNSNTFYTQTVTPGAVSLTPSLFTGSNNFYSAIVSQGGVVLHPSLYANANTFYTQIVSPGSVTLTPALLVNSNSFYNQSISLGAVNLTPNLFTNSSTFYAHRITGAGALLPVLFVNNNVFYNDTVTAGQVDLTASLYANSNTFYAQTIANVGSNQELTPSLFVNSSNFYIETISSDYALSAELLVNTNSIYNSEINVGAVDLTAQLFINSQIFRQHSINGAEHKTYPLAGLTQEYPLTGISQI